ncbi:PhoX family protein [Chitinophaga sedimenti]|uniref:PhoX family protein n=1 Tax=Chitinophaga sedimenti TaxID=2033606 RepID=UPI0020066166|nr:PhoX family protein [Chitinophaga sedimenti]MCK7558671.1 PhoX family protein [Chitinophaga sedimenti]
MTPLSKQLLPVIGFGLFAGIAFSACKDSEKPTPPANADIVLKNHSATPAFVTKKTGFENLEVYSLIGSDDVLPESNSFVFGGSADGAALLKQNDRYLMLVNHEDNFAVSRITLDKTFKPVKGEYILNSDGGQWRLCSATLAMPAEHGFGPIYLTCGESSVESFTNGLDPFAGTTDAGAKHELPALGHWSAENAVPLPKKAYTGKTVILIGDDDSGVSGGQLAMYVGNGVGDLSKGSLYMLKRKDGNQVEMDMKAGQMHDVEFVKVDGYETKTGAEINNQVDVLKAIKFGRVEDIDYRKGTAATGRDVYFNVTGQDKSGVNADGSRTKYGRTYHLTMDANDPLKGKLEVILDGDDKTGPAKDFQNVDNICVTENYVYIRGRC